MASLLLILLCCVACTEVIDLNTEDEPGQLVIFGGITNGVFGNELSIARTTLVGQPQEPIRGATVSVIDNEGREGRYFENEEGLYRLDSTYIGSPGRTYQIRVALPTGEIYESIPDTMPEISSKDSLNFELQEIEEVSDQGASITRYVVSIYADTEIFDPRPDLFIKWDVEEVYNFEQAVLPRHNFPFYVRMTCYITNELEQQRVMLYDGSELRAETIRGQRITDRTIDDDFRGVHYFNLIQQNLSSRAHSWWSALDKNVNRVGSIFDEPPGILPTNLYNVNDPEEQVLGFYQVVSTDTAHLKITNRIIDQFFSDPCPYTPEVDFLPLMCYFCLRRLYEPECIDCLLLPNSSLTRPSYFN